MAQPARYLPHYTVEDYEHWSGDWELWSGTAVAMSPSSKKEHQRISKRLVALWDQALKTAGCNDCEALQEVDWRVSSDTVYRPDIAVVCSDPGLDYIKEAPRFICEILSDSTREKDQHFKRNVYESLGVLYYLIADPDDSKLLLLELQDGRYRVRPELDQPLELTNDCQVTLDFSSVFQETSNGKKSI